MLGLVVLCSMLFVFCYLFFFFSSRRRHTRLVSDWSSDVCSSDLCLESVFFAKKTDSRQSTCFEECIETGFGRVQPRVRNAVNLRQSIAFENSKQKSRSEERRVGKECRYRWWQYN